MNRFALSIGALGVFHASFLAWAPVVMRWQTRNVLERFNSLESLELAMQVFQESMKYAYIESTANGAVMLLATALMYRHRVLGWRLWIMCLTIAAGATIISISINGASVGAVARLLLLAGFAYSTVRAYRSAEWLPWFNQAAET